MLTRSIVAALRHKNQETDALKTMSDVETLGHFREELTKECVMDEQMYGVVLWADECDRKAVIWCEDHGNLAYYSAAEHSAHQGVALDAGDLIQFELREEHDYRRARNLQHVDTGYAPSLPAKLRPARPSRPKLQLVSSTPAFA